jgi:2-aminoadipate transaminase
MPSRKGLSRRAKLAGGQPISALMHRALANPDLISLAAGFVDQETLPVDIAAEAIEAVLSDPIAARAALQYGTMPGHLPLRQAIVDRHCAADGQSATEAKLSVDQVLITAGSNQMLHLVLETLCDPQDIILCPAPTYFVLLGLLKNLDIHTVGIASDEDGMIPASLDEELTRQEAAGQLSRVKAIYVCSYFDNPSTTTLPAERRGEIVALAKKWSGEVRIHVIEDAAYRELRYAGDDIPSMRSFDEEGDTVITAGTFSKSFSPGMRIGWGILPSQLVEPIGNQKGNIDFGAPNFSQHVIAKVIQRGQYDTHVERLQANYRTKLQTTLDGADEYLAKIPGAHWHHPTGGLYVWLRLPEEIETGPSGMLVDRSLEEGMLYVPGEYFYPDEGVGVRKNTIRLSFGVQTHDKIPEGIAALARAIESL